jgi:hypothetical protein
MEQFILELMEKFPWIALVLTCLGSLVVIGQALVLVTPSKKDDEILDQIQKNSVGGAILNFLMRFAVIQKK